jgi:hypothetical protein
MFVRSFAILAASALAVLAPAVAAAAEPAASPAADPAGGATQAVWTPKQASFTYAGFTTRYSCEGLVSQVRSVLLSLGARRDDLVVIGTGCLEPGRPAPFPGVKVRMSVLTPAAGAAANAVAAQWKPVRVRLDTDPLAEAGQCELVEQIKQKLLPLFATREVEFRPNCVPHQLSPNGTRLSAQVLLPVPPARQASTAQAR